MTSMLVTQPEQVYDFLRGCGFAVTTMARWLGEQPDLPRARFIQQFATRENTYFMAYRDQRGTGGPRLETLRANG